MVSLTFWSIIHALIDIKEKKAMTSTTWQTSSRNPRKCSACDFVHLLRDMTNQNGAVSALKTKLVHSWEASRAVIYLRVLTSPLHPLHVTYGVNCENLILRRTQMTKKTRKVTNATWLLSKRDKGGGQLTRGCYIVNRWKRSSFSHLNNIDYIYLALRESATGVRIGSAHSGTHTPTATRNRANACALQT